MARPAPTLKIILLVLFFLSGFSLFSQDKILVFTKTNGFRHESIPAGIQMIEDLGKNNDLWEADNTEDASAFTTQNLKQYKAVVWCNTSGDDLLNADEQKAFEDYIADGGGFMGIHAATDTYRSGSWPFYNELVGGIVQTEPNHTASDYEATMTVVNAHPAVDFLDGPYTKKEEYYYWKINGGYLYENNINILVVGPTGEEDYDEPRPISWYKEYMGGRSFYTALGHNASDYTDDPNFIRHVEEGIKYVMGITLSVPDQAPKVNLSLYPNPAVGKVTMQSQVPLNTIRIFDIGGHEIKRVRSSNQPFQHFTFDSSPLQSGIYFILAQGEKGTSTVKFIKK